MDLFQEMITLTFLGTAIWAAMSIVIIHFTHHVQIVKASAWREPAVFATVATLSGMVAILASPSLGII